MTTEPIQHTDVTQVVQALKGSMLFAGLVLGILLYVLAYYQMSHQKNFFRFFFSKECITSILINLLVGVGLIVSWLVDSSSLQFLNIEKVTFIRAVVFGITGVLIIHNLIRPRAGGNVNT